MNGKLKLLEKNLIKNILVLEGGYNEEHEISISTAQEVKKAIKELNYHLESILVNPINFHDKIKKYKNIDVCFNCLHGPYGEDGTIQKILSDNKLKYTHSGIRASKDAFNKHLTKLIINKTQVNYLKSFDFTKEKINKNYFIECFKNTGPFILKPTSSGSSFGVKIFSSITDVEFFFNNFHDEIIIYKNHDHFMIEPYINSRELTVGIIEENGISKPIEVTEILSNNNIFDYEAKYTKGFSKHILPASIPSKIYNKCLLNAKVVHDTLGCKGVSRSDFLYDENNDKLFFLEINTQPGLTPLSLVPEQLEFRNINFTILIDKLIHSSL